MSLLKADGSRHLKVCIATPSQDLVHAGYTKDLVMLVAFMCGAHPEIKLSIVQNKGTILPEQRTTLVHAAREMQATHILWIDSDMRFPKDALVRLLEHNEPIVAANYSTRRSPILPTANHRDLGYVFTPPDSQGLEEVTSCGMGLMLCDMSVFAQLDQPWFMFGFNKVAEEYVGEDVFFCQRARAKGFHISVDQDLSKDVKHAGGMEFTHEHALMTRETLLARQLAEQESEDSEQPADQVERVLELVGALPANGRIGTSGDAHGP